MEKLLAHLFFFFFSFQIFSPSFNDRTIYLEIIVAMLNPYFWFWVKGNINRHIQAMIVAFVLLPIACLNPTTSIKIFSTILLVGFFFYSWQKGLFYIKYYISISILVAIVQFVTFYTNPSLCHDLGPTNLSHLVWGDYAAKTFTNFYSINGYFPRVSGLSREAGFFASYLIAYITLLYIEANRKDLVVSKKLKLWLGVGFVFSLSKMSVALAPAVLLEKINHQFRRFVPSFIVLIAFLSIMTIYWYHNDFLIQDGNNTFAHRFGAYAILPDVIDAKVLLFGEADARNLEGFTPYAIRFLNFASYYDEFAGLGGTILSNGIVLTLLFFLLLGYMGVSSTGIMMLLILTINVTIFTNQNFVILAYFIVLKYYCHSKVVTNV